MPKGKSSKALKPVTKKQVDVSQTNAINKLNHKVDKLMQSEKAEHTYVDRIIPGLAPGSTMNTYCLSDCQQGDGQGQRTGNKISCKWISGTITITPNLVTGTPTTPFTDIARVVVYRYKNNAGGVVPTAASVFENTTYPIETPFNYNTHGKEDVKVILDKTVCIGGFNEGAKVIKFSKNLHGAGADFTNTGTGYYDNGHYFMTIVSQNNTYKADFNVYTRVVFSR